MQGQRSIFDPFSEPVDLNHGPTFNGRGMNEPNEDNHMPSPTERQLLSNDLSGELNLRNSRGFSSWDVGESSSRSNAQNHDAFANDGTKVDHNRFSSFPTRDSRFKERESEPSNAHLGNGFSGSKSSHTPMNVDLNIGYGGNSSASSSRNALPLERGSGANVSNEARSLVQDPTNWSLATGWASTSSRSTLGTQSQQRLPDIPPWAFFPLSEGESGGHRARFPPPPSRSPTLEENAMPFGHQAFLRSPPLMEVGGDEWHSFAADIEERDRLVSEMRHICNAMRRGENLLDEDYMPFDPFINGAVELHDRHQDMRLDVDNMSYEELLALEERIGDVNTGLSEENILKSMKQRKHISFMAILTPNSEPCCICQEEYDTGDEIGILDCGHDFHKYCIKQWLTQKNLCPICKRPGLAT